jgi:large subunit ribosomal protein L13
MNSGFPGGGRTSKYKAVKDSKPEFIIYNSVKGMLPHNSLGSKLIKHLKVYVGENHPHNAQNPKSNTLCV